MKKSELRQLYKDKRMLLSNQEKADLDINIYSNLMSLNWSSVNYLHIYIPIERFKEPDSLHFVHYVKDKFPMISLVVSKTDFESNTMVNYLWDESLEFIENSWGILEPTSGQLVDEGLIDAVLVPLLVADENGNRVGYGKGFYDRFLLKCKESVSKIGISYFDPVDSIDDVGEWDIPLDILVTANNIVKF